MTKRGSDTRDHKSGDAGQFHQSSLAWFVFTQHESNPKSTASSIIVCWKFVVYDLFFASSVGYCSDFFQVIFGIGISKRFLRSHNYSL